MDISDTLLVKSRVRCGCPREMEAKRGGHGLPRANLRKGCRTQNKKMNAAKPATWMHHIGSRRSHSRPDGKRRTHTCTHTHAHKSPKSAPELKQWRRHHGTPSPLVHSHPQTHTHKHVVVLYPCPSMPTAVRKALHPTNGSQKRASRPLQHRTYSPVQQEEKKRTTRSGDDARWR